MQGSDAPACTEEELPPALAHVSPMERPAVLVPVGFLRIIDPALPLAPRESEASISVPRPQFPPVHYPPTLSSIKDIYLYSQYTPPPPPSPAAPCATSCQSLLSLSSPAPPLKTPGTAASRRSAFSKVGGSHQTSSSHCVLPSTVPPG